MFDIKQIRQNPEAFDANWARRGVDPQTPQILELDERRRVLQSEFQELQAQRNTKSKEIGKIKSQGGDADDLMRDVAQIKDKITALEEKEKEIADELNTLLLSLPNQIQDDVPLGDDENDNQELRRVGEPKTIENASDHVTIGEELGLMDFETAAKLSGSRFVMLKGHLARLERALAQFMLDMHVNEHGYTEISTPLMVRDHVLLGTGQLPKFEDDQFKTTRGDYLIPTAEVPLTNIVHDAIVDADDLPLRFTAFTPCFRQEAGAAGRDTRGMIRMHQFYKVELVSIVTPDKSMEEHERMTNCAEEVLKRLDLPYRVMNLCAGDIGFGATKTYDLEVWLPSQDTYREISSCSNCMDFQARRMKGRFRVKGEKETHFLHTLNGSGVAVGRALVAILENYWDDASKTLTIPDVLKPYMGGVESLNV